MKKQTACDVAGSGEVAQYLESKMVFAVSVYNKLLSSRCNVSVYHKLLCGDL